MDLLHNRRQWSDETMAMHGITSTPQSRFHIELDDRIMHPDDRLRLLKLHGELCSGLNEYVFEYRTILPDNRLRWIMARGKVLERQGGAPTRIVGIAADITEQKQHNVPHEQNNAEFRTLAEALPQLVWIADANGHVVYYNERRSLYSQASPGRISESQWKPLIHPDDLAQTLDVWARAMRDGSEYEMEHRLQMADGSFRWHLSRATPVKGEGKTIQTWFGTATDIDRLKQAESRVQVGVERLQLATESASMFAWEVDLKTGRLEWAENAAEIIGCSAEDLLHGEERGNFFVHPDDRSRLLDEFKGFIKSGADRFEMIFRGLPKNEKLKYWRTAGKILRNGQGVAERAVGVTQDVTRHMESAAQVKLLDERLTTAEEGAGAIVYDWNVTNDHVWRSHSLTVILGWEPQDLGNDPSAWQNLIHPDDLARINSIKMSDSDPMDDHYVHEYRVLHKDGRYRWMMDSGRIFRDESGTIIRRAGTTLDISTRKQMEMSQQRMANLIELSFEPIFVWMPERGIIEWNRGAEILYGFTRQEALGRQPQELLRTLYPIPFSQLMDHLQNTLNWSGEIDNFNNEGSLVVVESRYQLIQFDGETMVLETNRDIRERRHSAANIARMAAVAAASHDALYGANLAGIIEAWNPGAEKLFGYSESEALGKHISLLAQKDQHDEQLQFLRLVGTGETVKPFDTVRKHKDGSIIDVSMAMSPVKAPDGSVVAISVALHDIRERKEWDQLQLLMNRELAHRVKNSFAILQAILRSTIKTSRNPEEFAKAFSGRLNSMSAAHDVLTENDWRSAELGALLRHQLTHYLTGQRVRMTGGIINLAPEHAAPLSLIINELATNAVKYGALSVPEGRIDISWQIDQESTTEAKLLLTWEESGGPLITNIGERSFGTTLIERSLAGADVKMDFLQTGLHCRIAWPAAVPVRLKALH
jgi:PAS domain S-box-containing protein